MFNKFQEKKRMQAILDAHTPAIKAYEKTPVTMSWPEEKKKRSYVLFGSLGGALLTSAVCAGVIIAAAAPISFHPSYQLVTPSARAKSYSEHDTNWVSDKTATIYKAFCKEITPQVFVNVEHSQSFSLVDAFINLCLIGYTSNDNISNVVLSGLGASSREELKNAAKEIIYALGTPTTPYSAGGLYGGFSLQSLWLDENLALADDLGSMEGDLKDNFFCSVFHHQPTSSEVDKYYQAETPEQFSVSPSSSVPDGVESAAVSSYFVLDKYDSADARDYQNEYDSGNHLLAYTLFNGEERQVNYTRTENLDGKLYLNDHFIGADCRIAACSFTYFLPDEGYAPKDIAKDVFAENYTREGYSDTQGYDVTVDAPYFTIQNSLDLSSAYQNSGFDFMGQKGLFGKLLKDSSVQIPFFAQQSSYINYDYGGLYSASKTFLFGVGAMRPAERIYNLVLNRPYVFRVNSPTIKVGVKDAESTLPIIYGQIYDPAYQGR
jgi:hypothetical protein